MNVDLTSGNPDKVLWKFCLPLFLSIIFQQLYNIADSWVAGRFISENALAAIGNSYEITLVFIAVAFGCNIGCSILASRYFGGKDYKMMKTSITTSMIVSLLFCGLLMFFGLVYSLKLLHLIHTPDNLLFDSHRYLTIYIYGLPFTFFYNISTGIFSALGDSKTPFYFLVVSSLSNIVMDIIFVKDFSLGVMGIAWATFICQGMSCILSIVVVYLRIHQLHIQEHTVLFDKNILIQFLKIAIPSILQQSFISIGNVIIQGIINVFGSGVIAGYSAGVKLNNLVITSFTTLGNGISNYTSQNLGAKKYTRIKEGFFAGIKIVWCLSLPLALIYFLFPHFLLSLFLENPTQTAVSSATLYLRILAPFYFVVSAKLVSDGILRGSSMMNQFMIGTFTDLLLRVILAMILSKTALGYVGIWIAWPIGWIISTIISISFVYKRKWQ